VARVNGASLWTAGDVRAGYKQLLLHASCRFSARLLLTGLLLLPIMAYEHAVLTALYVGAAIAIGAAEAASHCQYLYQVRRLATFGHGTTLLVS
jgi:hypothetical protein